MPLDNPSVSATNYTGAIAGGNYSSIESCTVSVGTVSASFVAGGIAGRNGGTVSSCTNSGTLKGSNTDDIANE